jgi:hypothetical protein
MARIRARGVFKPFVPLQTMNCSGYHHSRDFETSIVAISRAI